MNAFEAIASSSKFIQDSPLLKHLYCESRTQYIRRPAMEVQIGEVPVGGSNPIRIQSMTTTDTMDTKGTVGQAIRMIEAGCEYVRVTAPSLKEAQNLENIKNELRKQGYKTPLVADIHFTPNAAELAARIVEKVRINPGNYADRKRFETIDYTEEGYKAELERIRERFVPLVRICKEYGTALRIGTNHGSLSDRIMSRYGDTPLGMTESALEFIRICEEESFYQIVVSMKSSNPQVMVQAYRLLATRLRKEELKPYPFHLGVTEAGEGEDGRIKSAVGIGTLLEDGLGDTIRVSLTEEPEYEIPVARALAERYVNRAKHAPISELKAAYPIDPFSYNKRTSVEVENVGGGNVPRIISDLSIYESIIYEELKSIGHYYFSATDKWNMSETGADYVYTGDKPISFMLPNGLREILNFKSWAALKKTSHTFPLFSATEYLSADRKHPKLNFIRIHVSTELKDAFKKALQKDTTAVLIFESNNIHASADIRRAFVELEESDIKCPVFIARTYIATDHEDFLLHASVDTGTLLTDGLGDGLMLRLENEPTCQTLKICNDTAFGILQATRTRISKTEYISCPSCGRTLFDLQETTALIRKRTDHLKGVKIGIMGCIVNGPGEMADADYGYVGVGKGKIALYRGKEVVKKFVPAERAVDELIDLIREDNRWTEPKSIQDY